MSFRIHTSSPELKRELEKTLAGIEGQLDADYEISAEVLSAEQALDRAGALAAETGADSIFVAAGTFTKKEIELPAPVNEEPVAAPQQASLASLIPTSSEEQRRPDTELVRQTLAEKSARARELSAKLVSQTGSFMKKAGSVSKNALGRAGEWASEKSFEARVASGELRKRFAERAEQSRQRAAEWNARRLERQAAEAKSRAERERAAHREAELAAAAAHIMHREQKNKETELNAARQKARVVPPAARVTEPARERDTWPIWRSAFAVAACLALVGIFLLAAGGKQSSASPATSTEVVRPVLPEGLPLPPVVNAAPQPKPTAQKPVAALPVAKVVKPSPRKPVARTEDDNFEEVTVRHYPNASPIAPPKKDAKGVVQISDME